MKILSKEEIRRGEAQERFAAIQRQALVDEIRNKEATLSFDGVVDSLNADLQQGRRVHVSTVMQRLQKMNPSLLFEPSKQYPEKMGIYVIENRPDETGTPRAQLRFICGMENGWMPEFTIAQAEETRLPDPDFDPTKDVMETADDGWLNVSEYKDETRGWRNVLFRLIQARLIDEAQAERHFNISQGRSSEKWKGLLN